MSKIKEYIDFPTIFTFKIVGDNIPGFTFGVEEMFNAYVEKSIVPTESANSKYISLSVTVELKSYEELESAYEKISKLRGLRFYV